MSRNTDLWPGCGYPAPRQPTVGGTVKRTSLSILIAVVVIALGASAASATFPGTNGRIIWLKNGHVASVKPDGSGFRRLTTGTSDYMETPTCSPDGRWVTFAGQTATL